MPIHKWSQCWGAGKAQRGLGPQARVWRELSYREILAAEFAAPMLSETRAFRNVCRRRAICDFLNTAR